MNNSAFDILSDRVNRLERENRRLKWVGAVILIAAAGLSIWSARRETKNRSIEGERIILHDKKGKMLALLEGDKDGLPNLAFYGKEGRAQIKIGIDQVGGPNIDLQGVDEKGGVGMSVTTGGASSLVITEPGGEYITLVAAGKPDHSAALDIGNWEKGDDFSVFVRNGESTIHFLTENKGLLAIGKGKDGAADIVVPDNDGKTRLILGRGPDGSAYLKRFDKDGKVTFQLP